jgi:flavin-dependent dehydrogenase
MDTIPLDDGARIAVIGGGPAGAFFSYFVLDMAQRVDIALGVDVYESKDFDVTGPAGCNHCAGIVSESLVQILASEGINLPPTVIKRGIDNYVLYTDVGDVRIETPLHEMRIAAIHRGAGPRGMTETQLRGLDGYLLGLAESKGARLVRDRVDAVGWIDHRPQVKTKGGGDDVYDLLVVAAGVNTTALKLIEGLETGYQSPRTTKTFISELHLGEELVEQYLGSAVHVFLLDMPKLEFAMIIPKATYATFCILGEDIDNELVQAVLKTAEIRRCLPPGWELPDSYCRCAPKVSISDAKRPYANRLVVLGDSGVTRLYKDGIGAAYRAAKAAARTVVFEGVSTEAFRKYYDPFCRNTRRDNLFGRLIFTVTRQIQHRRYLRRGALQTLIQEQRKRGRQRRLSMILWDTFTGSGYYRDIFMRTLHPLSFSRLLWNTLIGLFFPRIGGGNHERDTDRKNLSR